jgi:succinate-semialdehyde dehydrogenase/glutarate-semialdehyde dehydrogenase
MPIASVNPATGETLQTFTPLTDAEVQDRLQRAADAFQAHRRTSFADRAAKMMRAGEILDAEKHAIAQTMTLEVGKTLRSSVEEAEKCARACRYYAENAERLLADQPYTIDGARAFVRSLPLGPVLAVMPWNFPLWQVIRFAAPALMAGNVGLLKHAPSVPQCALFLEDLFRRAGFGEGVFQTLLIETEQVAAILDDPRVAAATLTGSERAGSAVAGQAGRRVKKTVLELGGSDPFIVMPSADMDAAVQTAVKARTLNNGQSCIAAKRFLVHEAVADEWTRRFVDGMASLTVGDPMDPATDVGPLATPSILEGLASQVDRSVAAGARVLLGGRRLDGPGYFYAPTILSDIPPDAPAYREELFGPVALLFRVKDIGDAIRQANDTPFGLGSSVWTKDTAEQDRFINEIEAGMTFVNGMVASDPRLPFGGIKHSGYGRELSEHGLREFVNLKTVWVKNDAGQPPWGRDTE